MRNKTTKVVILSLMGLLLVGSNAFAAFELNTYAAMYTTGAKGSSIQQSSFTLAEQPWLYIRFFSDQNAETRIGSSSTDTMWTWNGGEVADKSFLKFYLGSKNDVWIGFSEDYWKNTMQTVGDWTISAQSLLNDKVHIGSGSNLKSYGDVASFKVNAVPEPVSALLFLTGGAAIAAFRRRKA